jgi:hypothetical protein
MRKQYEELINMSTWMVNISGKEGDVKYISQVVKAVNMSIIQEDGEFYLKSDEFNTMNNASKIFEYANQFLKVAFSIANLYYEKIDSISCSSVTCINDKGEKSVFIFLSSTIKVSTRVESSIIVTDSQEITSELERQEKEYEVFINAARKDKNILDAINFYLTPNWINLYKAYELIKDDVTEKKIISYGWASKRNISRFKQSAQCRELLGNEARHASKKYPLPSDPMDIDEAKYFIKYLLFDWMKSKQ